MSFSLEPEEGQRSDLHSKQTDDTKHIELFFLTDQFEKVKKSYQESLRAEERCNASVSGPLSPAEQSRDTRGVTEGLLDASRHNFLRALAAQNQTLSALQQNAHQLDRKLLHLSHMVGGAGGRSSPQGVKEKLLGRRVTESPPGGQGRECSFYFADYF